MGEEIQLNEKTQSAYGLEQYYRSLSYATDRIDSSFLDQSDGNLLSENLEGNIHGLHILPDEVGPGHSSLLSFWGSLTIAYRVGWQPLIVVDVIPLDNTLYFNGDGHSRTLSSCIDVMLL